MKLTRLPLIFALLILVFGLIACGGSEDPASDEGAATSEDSGAAESATESDAVEESAPEETAEDPAVELGPEIRSDEGGFAFNGIPGYETENLMGIIQMAPPRRRPRSWATDDDVRWPINR